MAWGGVPDLSKGYGVIRGQCGNKETALTVFVGILRGIAFMEGTAGKAAAAVASVSRVMITFIVSLLWVCAIVEKRFFCHLFFEEKKVRCKDTA